MSDGYTSRTANFYATKGKILFLDTKKLNSEKIITNSLEVSGINGIESNDFAIKSQNNIFSGTNTFEGEVIADNKVTLNNEVVANNNIVSFGEIVFPDEGELIGYSQSHESFEYVTTQDIDFQFNDSNNGIYTALNEITLRR